MREREVCSHAQLPPGAPGRAEDRGGPSFRAGMELGLLQGWVLCWMSPEGPGTRDGGGVGAGAGADRKAARLQEGLPSPAEVGGPEPRLPLLGLECPLLVTGLKANPLQGNSVHCLSDHPSDSGRGHKAVPGAGCLPLLRSQWQRAPCAPLRPCRGPLPTQLRSHPRLASEWQQFWGGRNCPATRAVQQGTQASWGCVSSPSLQAGKARLGAQPVGQHPGGLSAPRGTGVSRPRF